MRVCCFVLKKAFFNGSPTGSGFAGKSTMLKSLLAEAQPHSVKPDKDVVLRSLMDSFCEWMNIASNDLHHVFDDELRAFFDKIHERRFASDFVPDLQPDKEMWLKIADEMSSLFYHLPYRPRGLPISKQDVHRFCSPEFVPTLLDMLVSRRRTVGINIHELLVGDSRRLCLVETGGPRSER